MVRMECSQNVLGNDIIVTSSAHIDVMKHAKGLKSVIVLGPTETHTINMHHKNSSDSEKLQFNRK